MSCNAGREFDYNAYFQHGLQAAQEEVARLSEFSQELPDVVIDAHTHASTEDSFNVSHMSEFTWGHMVSTYPVTTIEQSAQVSSLMFPGVSVRKLRFAHAFRGIAHADVNTYLRQNTPAQDRVALFGLHETPEEIDYTVDELAAGAYNGLKMYYSAGQMPRYELFEYFPKPVLATAEKHDVPIILHLPNTAEGSMDEVRGLTENFPRLRVVLAHMGVTWIDHPGLEPVFDELADHPNVFMDTSGVADAGVIAKGIRSLGITRILFGSDEPLNMLREQTYEHPEKGPRIISDFPYHWVDPEEFAAFRDVVERPKYSQLLQLEALMAGVGEIAGSEKQKQAMLQAVLHDNTSAVFGF